MDLFRNNWADHASSNQIQPFIALVSGNFSNSSSEQWVFKTPNFIKTLQIQLIVIQMSHCDSLCYIRQYMVILRPIAVYPQINVL